MTKVQDGLPAETTELAGWGRYPTASGLATRPERISAVREVVASERWTSVLARGLGRSYGDPAFNPEGCTLLTERLDRLISFDPASGWLRAEGGLSFRAILDLFLPRGWFLPVTPGTRHVTLAGALACDVHGKNHHRDGSVGRHLGRLRMLLASGEEVECSAQERPELFHATVGGMGLTGVVLEAELRLRPIQTAMIRQQVRPAGDLDSLMALLEEHDTRVPYSVAWLDTVAQGRNLGRGVLLLGDHAEIADLPSSQAGNPLRRRPGLRATVPFDAPGGLLNPTTIRAFNATYFNLQKRKAGESLIALEPYFYPLDIVDDWNRMYGRSGFVQYQFVVPTATARSTLVGVLEACARQGLASFLSVLKRFGPGAGNLSFPFEGYTLTLDFPVAPGLFEFLDELDRRVLDAGGRLYLAKDARMSPASFRAMYPEFPRWLEVKRQVDPHDRFRSAQSIRLGMHSLEVPSR